MSQAAKPCKAARALVDEVLGRRMTREIWSGNYEKVLPLTLQGFDLGAVLPAVFYMFRFGHRRGRGRFFETFAGLASTHKQRMQAATVERVAATLAQCETFTGFAGETEQAILGDLLLAFCLENRSKALGRKEPVARVAPAHYLASWIDLPAQVANLRYVPEMLVALLADKKGDYVDHSHPGDGTHFAVGHGFEENMLLRAFNQGVRLAGELGSRTADMFDESVEVGLDQLLMIRIAQCIGQAPDKLRAEGSDSHRISNQRPVAEQAARHFSQDMRRFVLAYGQAVPRYSFVEMLEACIALGLTTILTSTTQLLFAWADTGTLPETCNQQPVPLFVDASNGVHRRLRAVAEQSLDDFIRRLDLLPVILSALRLLDHGVRHNPDLRRQNVSHRPYATHWVNFLGDILHNRLPEARPLLYYFEHKARELGEVCAEEYPEAKAILCNDAAQPNPVWRLADALTLLQGRRMLLTDLHKLMDSVLLTGHPHGFASKRRVQRSLTWGSTTRREVRAMVFTDAVLDYLVHLHVACSSSGGGYRLPAFAEFLRRLRERYGLCVDMAPPGLTVSNELLCENRTVLEQRLRDLGVLVGVNDAEAMKHLQTRFVPSQAHDDDVD